MDRNDRNSTDRYSLLERRAEVVPRGVAMFNAATAVSARGALIVDESGRELIDLTGGIGVMTVGHCEESVVRAIQRQAEQLLHACIHVATYEPYIALCERLARLLPHGPQTKVMLVNTGAEAVENAVKIARQATGRPAIVAFTEGFHGRTLLCMTLTSKAGYKIGCGPFAPEVYRLPYPNLYRYGDGLSPSKFVDRELRRFRQALVNNVPAEHVAAVLIEGVQGEGGFVVAPVEYLRGLRKICDEHGILMICDEVQTGLCRTGRWAAYEHAGIVPDLSTWAKALGGGLPIGAVVGKATIMDAARPATIGGTFGGNPVSCAAALAALDFMEKSDLNRRAASIGQRIRERFLSMQDQCTVIGDVRGLGAMMAMELIENGDLDRPATQLVSDIVAACLRRGVLIVPAGAHGNIIRILVPLVILDEQLEQALAVLEEEVLRLTLPSGAAVSRRSAVAARE